jgi:hypothetical protein
VDRQRRRRHSSLDRLGQRHGHPQPERLHPERDPVRVAVSTFQFAVVELEARLFESRLQVKKLSSVIVSLIVELAQPKNALVTPPLKKRKRMQMLRCQNREAFPQPIKPIHFNLTNYKLNNTNYKLNNTNYKLNNTNYKLNNTNYKLKYTNYKLKYTNYKLKYTNYKLQYTNYKLNNTSYSFTIKFKVLQSLLAQPRCKCLLLFIVKLPPYTLAGSNPFAPKRR